MTEAHIGFSPPTSWLPLIKNLARRRDSFHRQIARLVFVILTLAGCHDTPGSRILAEIQESAGNTFLLGPSGEPASRILLRPGATISTGHTIETDRGATATISLMPALLLRLNPESSVSIQKLLLVKRGNALEYPMKSRQARLRLISGSFSASTPPIIAHVDFEISTPAGTAIAPALTVFSVGLDGEKVRAVVAQGQLRFRSKNGELGETVTERQFAEWNATSGAVITTPRDVEIDQRAVQGLRDAAEFGRRAAELTARARDRRLPGM
jgi:hypothetical protein